METFVYSEEHAIPTVEKVHHGAELAEIYPDCIYFEVEEPVRLTDTDIVDRIATLLGTSSEWDSEYLEWIAEQIAKVRPHPGDTEATYRADFLAATGRPVSPAFDQTEEG